MAALEAPGDEVVAGSVHPKPRSPSRLRAASGVVRRLGWGVVDQVVSSLTNFAVSIYVVHRLGATQFGAFSLAYVTYGFALNASRGLSTDPLMVRFSGAKIRTWRNAVRNCTGTALLVGLVCGLFSLATAAVLRGQPGPRFLALGLTLPVLMLQDSWRFSFFALGRGVHAVINDTVWAVTLIPALLLLGRTGHANVFWFTFAWGATACVGAIAGIFQAHVVPHVLGARHWLSRHQDLGIRYLLEGTSSSVVSLVRGYGTGLLLGLAAVGYLQSSITLYGPMTYSVPRHGAGHHTRGRTRSAPFAQASAAFLRASECCSHGLCRGLGRSAFGGGSAGAWDGGTRPHCLEANVSAALSDDALLLRSGSHWRCRYWHARPRRRETEPAGDSSHGADLGRS